MSNRSVALMTEIQIVVVCSIILLILALVVVAMFRDYFNTEKAVNQLTEKADKYLAYTQALYKLKMTHGIGLLTNKDLIALYRESEVKSELTNDLKVYNVLYAIGSNGDTTKIVDEVIECAKILDQFEDYQIKLDAIKINKKH